MVYNWLLSGLFPPICLLCGQPGVSENGRDLCSACEAELGRIVRPCERCGIPLPPQGTHQGLCGRCQRRPPVFDRCIAPFLYKDQIGFLVTQLKYAGNLSCARLLGDLLAEHLAKQKSPMPDLLMPVPLHPSRIRERGFNQALEIGRLLARRLDLPMDSKTLKRTRATDPQTELSLQQRLSNLKGAFSLRRPLAAAHVALVDDVVTTGSTAAEIAKVLKQSGVSRVSVWAPARTPR